MSGGRKMPPVVLAPHREFEWVTASGVVETPNIAYIGFQFRDD
jgi:hypothetical protein